MKRTILSIAVVVAFSACMAPANKNAGNDTVSKNEALMTKFTDEVINKHNIAMIDSLVAPDYMEHQADPNYSPDRAGLKKSMEDFAKGFPDANSKINFMMADSDRVMIEYTLTGTNTGSMMSMPATGKKMNIEGVDIVRFKDGKAIEHWGFMEEMKLMQQMGMMPAMGGKDSAKAQMPNDSSKKM